MKKYTTQTDVRNIAEVTKEQEITPIQPPQMIEPETQQATPVKPAWSNF